VGSAGADKAAIAFSSGDVDVDLKIKKWRMRYQESWCCLLMQMTKKLPPIY